MRKCIKFRSHKEFIRESFHTTIPTVWVQARSGKFIGFLVSLAVLCRQKTLATWLDFVLSRQGPRLWIEAWHQLSRTREKHGTARSPKTATGIWPFVPHPEPAIFRSRRKGNRESVRASLRLAIQNQFDFRVAKFTFSRHKVTTRGQPPDIQRAKSNAVHSLLNTISSRYAREYWSFEPDTRIGSNATKCTLLVISATEANHGFRSSRY
ncbi:hypothetical protein K0M31_001157 [Melipona bicolor]|uniref:Uncharacterized protein n=1 Tax=Melipona bicolor TaxID=60889 RepID=A0AA40KXG1_9HYME|nr:hypothetical protein K0M31_001157 [Melipona bicolor]